MSGTPFPTLAKGRYRVRLAAGPEDVVRAQELRHLCFHGRAGADRDKFDPICQHVLVEEVADGRLAGCFRLMALPGGREFGASYAAQFYDLSRLAIFDGPVVEMGRFCIRPDVQDADALRLAWGALAAHVEAQGVQMLFGCASFPGTDWRTHADAFTLLATRHLGPDCWRPGAKAPEVVRFADVPEHEPDILAGLRGLPPLLRTYLSMGGWVGDHAVVDRQLGTLHVFTVVEIARIPAARRRLLRALAG